MSREAECIHDLAPGSCATCNGTARRQEREAAPRGPAVEARYSGRCSGCDENIRPGDQIRADGEGGWLCNDCHDDVTTGEL